LSLYPAEQPNEVHCAFALQQAVPGVVPRAVAAFEASQYWVLGVVQVPAAAPPHKSGLASQHSVEAQVAVLHVMLVALAFTL